ncbi:type II RES/Xre toxin-antitoxin system antitoxin [Deinococcus sp. SL84]|uniref:type II RES/Xre toxin-antitoxin system antitoxin n=1 Tax=Deinococcus sp. SL84 TaxID=2994663 RepID=UPI0022768C6B|nr:antitoxin Xre-like helix-turn-helix domain-containing protein [Deinococcus sp. SL84]MCY1703960.1 DUF2384 domain-containing protein [Deinococcus sp. SL84]
MTQTFTPTWTPPPFPGTSLLGLDASTLLELGDAVDQGFQSAALEGLARHLGMTLGQMLALLGISESTYHSRRRSGRPLSADDSAALYHLARVTEAAEQYFTDPAEAHRWLGAPRVTFGNRTPLQFALLPGGAEYVTAVLGRLEHGVYV